MQRNNGSITLSDSLKKLSADEMFDVLRDIRPELSREEFEREWAAFQGAVARSTS